MEKNISRLEFFKLLPFAAIGLLFQKRKERPIILTKPIVMGDNAIISNCHIQMSPIDSNSPAILIKPKEQL